MSGSRWIQAVLGARAAALGLALLVGCSSTGVGNPAQESATLSLSIVTDDEAERGAADPDAALPAQRLRHAILAFRELRWLPCDQSEEAVVVEGQIVVNLVTGRVEPELPRVPVPPSGFCGLDAPLMPAEWPPGLVGRSLLFAGLRQDGVLFLLYSSIEGTLRLRPREGVVWGAGDEDSAVIWAQRPRRWLTDEDLDGVESVPVGDVEDADAVDGVGAVERVIPIDADRHPALLALIRARLAGRSSLYADLNKNGRLDLAERADAAWLGSGLSDLD